MNECMNDLAKINLKWPLFAVKQKRFTIKMRKLNFIQKIDYLSTHFHHLCDAPQS